MWPDNSNIAYFLHIFYKQVCLEIRIWKDEYCKEKTDIRLWIFMQSKEGGWFSVVIDPLSLSSSSSMVGLIKSLTPLTDDNGVSWLAIPLSATSVDGEDKHGLFSLRFLFRDFANHWPYIIKMESEKFIGKKIVPEWNGKDLLTIEEPRTIYRRTKRRDDGVMKYKSSTVHWPTFFGHI